MSATGTRHPGERITAEKRSRAGRRLRSGVITEVLGSPEHEHYLVRWDDGKTSAFYPAHGEEVAPPPEPPAVAPAAPREPEPPRPPERKLIATPGDRLVVHGHHLGEPERDAEILEARGPGGTAPFLVRWWDSGQETLVFPGSDTTVEHLGGRRRRRRSA
jgi:hypothetical protein